MSPWPRRLVTYSLVDFHTGLAEEAAAREAAALKAAEEAAAAEELAKKEAEAAAAAEAKAQREREEAARALEELKKQEADAARIVRSCVEMRFRVYHASVRWRGVFRPSTRR